MHRPGINNLRIIFSMVESSLADNEQVPKPMAEREVFPLDSQLYFYGWFSEVLEDLTYPSLEAKEKKKDPHYVFRSLRWGEGIFQAP